MFLFSKKERMVGVAGNKTAKRDPVCANQMPPIKLSAHQKEEGALRGKKEKNRVMIFKVRTFLNKIKAFYWILFNYYYL